MRSKTIATLLITLIVGSCLTAVVLRREALAQDQPKNVRWEYKVKLTYVGSPELQEADETEARFDKAYNALGSEGWEYVGPVYAQQPTRSVNGHVIVLFRRPKI